MIYHFKKKIEIYFKNIYYLRSMKVIYTYIYIITAPIPIIQNCTSFRK